MKPAFHLDTAGRAAVSRAVTRAESHSAGEIVTILTDSSDDYGDVALAWSALVAFTALALFGLMHEFYLGLFDRLTGTWRSEWSISGILELATVIAIVKFGSMWLLQLWAPLKFLLIPAPLKARRVRQRAIAAFRIGAERRTHGRTGILIYLSMREHRAEIVADEAIASKVDPAVWGDAMAALVGAVREGRVSDGMVAAVEKVGAVLAQHFPRGEGDVNELPDRLIEI
jgi:putative membrane protein